MAEQYWNGYQWRELAEGESPPAVIVEQREGTLLSRSMKPTRRELQRLEVEQHTHYFENDVCACGARETDG